MSEHIDLLSFNPLQHEFVQNPYPFFKALREQKPVFRNDAGAWVLTRYTDVIEALSNPLLGNSPSKYAVVNKRNREKFVCADVANNIIPFIDPPEHTLSRRQISSCFHQHLKESELSISMIAEDIFSSCLKKKEFDLIEDFATPYSVRVMSDLIGIPRKDEKLIKRWSKFFFYLFTFFPSEKIRQETDNALTDFRKYLFNLIQMKKNNPSSDLVSKLLSKNLSELELVDNLMLIFSDGVENVDSAIANSFQTLFNYPDQLETIKRDPSLFRAAVNECLRYESPGQFIGRVALEDLTIAGTLIKKNAAVLLVIGSANRDPSQFSNPDLFDIHRSDNSHIAFGRGRHNCIGASLVVLEIEKAFETILKYQKQLIQTNTAPHWEARIGHRWLSKLPLKVV